jgi:hypothetical protein
MWLTPLTTTTIRRREDLCMNLWSCCISKWDELHVQSCHSYRLRESDDVATQHAGHVFLYAFGKTCMQCRISWSVYTWIIVIVVSSCAWSCNNRNWQRQPSVKGKTHALFFWIVALCNAMIGMSSRHLFWILGQCIIYVWMFLCMYVWMSSYVFSLFSVSRSHIYVYIYIYIYTCIHTYIQLGRGC